MTEPVTRQQLEATSLNCDAIEQIVEGDENTTVTTPKGRQVSTFSKALKALQLAGGLLCFATKADMLAYTPTGGSKQLARVLSDSTSANNGDYLWNGTAWVKGAYDPVTQAQAYADTKKTEAITAAATDATAKANTAKTDAITAAKDYVMATAKQIVNRNTLPVFENLSKNLFDPDTVLLDKHLSGTGETLIDSVGSVVSGLIYVKGLSRVTLSGIPSSTAYRPSRFLDAMGKFLQIGVAIPPNNTSFSYATIPAGASWMQISLKTPADGFTLDTSVIQVESGNTATTYTAYVRGSLLGYYGSLIKSVFDNKAAEAFVAPKYRASGKNKFQPNTVVQDAYISTSNGSVIVTAGAIATDYIDVSHMQNVALSGLGTSTAYRPVAFYDKNKNFLSALSVQPNTTGTRWTVPAGAAYFRATVYVAGQPAAFDPSTIQIEDAPAATAYEAPILNGITQLFGKPINGADVTRSRAIGAKYLIFGDSITSTCSVDSGIFDSPFGNTNWPTYAFKTLNMSVFRNYAKSGASFASRNNGTYLYLQNQISKAIQNAETPDIIIVACGTNDAAINLGTYDNAVNKDLSAIDPTVTLEAARVAFQTLRQQWPDAWCFYCNPLQRGSSAPEILDPASNELGRLAKRFGFILIDQRAGSGIIKELENATTAGKYLADGLHPNEAGKVRQANYICSEIIKSMLYYEAP